MTKNLTFTCPIGIKQPSSIQLAHGSGGKLMHQLIEGLFLPAFGYTSIDTAHDSAVVDWKTAKMAFTTDSYVVYPHFFPGGDIGMLAVNGTVNDLAMSGAIPLYLSLGFILEEGLPMEVLKRIVLSIQKAAEKANIQIITGDTKVVDKGKGDGIFINTAGVGAIEHDHIIAPQSVQAGDVVIVNGDLARHGMAIMAVREGLEFESSIESDTAPLSDLVQKLLSSGVEIHCLRDLTRGGLASTLNEIASAAHAGIKIDEASVPVREEVQAACELLGFDPLYVANEGRFVAIVAQEHAELACKILKAHPLGKDAAVIGKVLENPTPPVTVKSKIGVTRILDMLSGEQLPRIC